MHYLPPPPDCPLCTRLATFREANRKHYPTFFNAPVPSFGSLDARLLVVGLAPGLKGANRTGRPFTGDYAGIVLYSALAKFGLARGQYDPARVHAPTGEKVGEGDGFALTGCRITNAGRCVPPENKPEPAEVRQCNRFLVAEMQAMPQLQVILSLGLISHKAVLLASGYKQSSFPFMHGDSHALKIQARPVRLFNSYHCSRYNINTGKLTQAMFDAVVEQAAQALVPSPVG